MKKLLLLLSLLIGSNLIALEKEVSSSFESTWSKVLLLMSTEDAKTSFIDKSSGLLQASINVPTGLFELYYSGCQYPKRIERNYAGGFISFTSDISVVVQEVSNDRSKIIITSNGEIESYRYRKLFGIPFIKTKRVIYYTSCVSNDRLERNLLKKFSGA